MKRYQRPVKIGFYSGGLSGSIFGQIESDTVDGPWTPNEASVIAIPGEDRLKALSTLQAACDNFNKQKAEPADGAYGT